MAHACLLERGLLYLVAVFAVLCDEEAFKRSCEIEGTEPAVQAETRFCRMADLNLQQLVRWAWLQDSETALGVTAQRSFTLVAMRYAGLFTVAKANGRMRVISNGVPGNEVLRRPPYFKFSARRTSCDG